MMSYPCPMLYALAHHKPADWFSLGHWEYASMRWHREVCSLSAVWLGDSWQVQSESPRRILIYHCVNRVTDLVGQASRCSRIFALQIPGGSCHIPSWWETLCPSCPAHGDIGYFYPTPLSYPQGLDQSFHFCTFTFFLMCQSKGFV